MKKNKSSFTPLIQLTVCMVIALLVVQSTGCTPTEENEMTGRVIPIEDTFAPNVTVINQTAETITRLQLTYGNSAYEITDFAPDEQFLLTDVVPLYQWPDKIMIETAAGTIEQESMDGGAKMGEPPITAGLYHLIIGTGMSVELQAVRPETIQPLLDQIPAAQWERSIQRGTPFDELAGETVAERQILRMKDERSERVDVYIFADETTAQTYGETIQSGGTLLTQTNEDGTTQSVSVAPNWWQTGRYLINYQGNATPVVEALEQVAGAPLAQPEVVTDGINLRIINYTDMPFDEVTVQSGTGNTTFDTVPARSASAYQPMSEAYHYGSITIAANGDTYEHPAIDYVGETVLQPGNYSYVIDIVDGEIRQMVVNEDAPHVDEALIGRDWYYIGTKTAAGHYTAAASYTNEGKVPYLNFTADAPLNNGDIGFPFGGLLSCNNGFGNYLINQYGGLYISGIGSTAMLCPEPIMQSERSLSQALSGLSHYRIVGDVMMVRSGNGDLLLFSGIETVLTAADHTKIDTIAPFILQFEADVTVTQIPIEPPPFAELEGSIETEIARWQLMYLDEAITLHVFPDGESLNTFIASATFIRSWTMNERVLITYDGDEAWMIERINDVVNGQAGEIWQIGAEQVDCVGVAPQTCLLVKRPNDTEFTLFYDSIAGFTFTPGFEQTVKVEVTEVENPPADASQYRYRLLDLLSVTPRPQN